MSVTQGPAPIDCAGCGAEVELSCTETIDDAFWQGVLLGVLGTMVFSLFGAWVVHLLVKGVL